MPALRSAEGTNGYDLRLRKLTSLVSGDGRCPPQYMAEHTGSVFIDGCAPFRF